MFDLPKATNVNNNVPKNAFDNYTNTKQKQKFSTLVGKIHWLHKLSATTLNLPAGEIHEIQIFELQLKQKSEVAVLLDIIDKSIPYPIIFIVRFNEEYYYSTAKKHSHPTNENISVIDWRFKSQWQKAEEQLNLSLSRNLDYVFNDFCFQLSGKTSMLNLDIELLIAQEQEIKELQLEISKTVSAIKNCKQFNKKVELNLHLSDLQAKLLNLS